MTKHETPVHDLTVHEVPADKLTPHPDNARHGDVGAIHQSLETNGLYRPIVVQGGTGFILAGNHTYRALVQAGRTTIPAVILDVDEDEARRIMLADNRTADLGDYDTTALLELLQGLPDLEGTGYDDDDLDSLLKAAGDAYEPEETPDAFEEYGDDIPTDHECPSCGYRWSGSTAPKKGPASAASEEDPADA